MQGGYSRHGSIRRHHRHGMALRGPLSLLWLALSATGPAACFVVLPASTRIVAAASPLPKVALGSRQGAHGVVRGSSGGQEQRRLPGFTRGFQQERAGRNGQREEEEEEEDGEERAGGQEGGTATGANSAPAAHHAIATGIRRARALVAATGLSRGKGLGFREAAAVKASAPGEAEAEAAAAAAAEKHTATATATLAGEGRSAAPATGHAVGAGIRRAKSLVAMVGLSRGKGSRAAATALGASSTGADVAPPAETSTSRPKKILIIMSDTGGGHRASSQALSAALENLYGDQVSAYACEGGNRAQRWRGRAS